MHDLRLPGVRPGTALRIAGPVELGRAVRDLRERGRLRRDDLAANARVHPGTISALEMGARWNPSVALLASIASRLNVSVAALTDAFLLPLAGGPHAHPAAHNPRLPQSIPRLAELDVVGALGMGRVLLALRGDCRARLGELAAVAAISSNHLSHIERGMVEQPGLHTIARIVHAASGNRAKLPQTAERVGTTVQVFAGELTAFDAIKRHRRAMPAGDAGRAGG